MLPPLDRLPPVINVSNNCEFITDWNETGALRIYYQLESLCDRLPTELAMRILRTGVNDTEYGLAFGAKCMSIALWIQPIVAPILYRVVTIHNSKDGQSLFLAIDRNLHGKRYSPRALINTLVIRDDSETQSKDPIYATVIAEIILALNNSYYKRLNIPLHLMDYSPLHRPYAPLLPYSVTFNDAKGSLFPHYTYAAVTKLRLVHFDPQMWEIRGLLAVAKRVTHLSLTLSSNAWAAVSLVESVSRLAQMKILVIIVKMSPDEEHLSQLLKLKEEPPTWVEGIILSKVVLWEWSAQVQALLDDANDENLWKTAEATLLL